jgi:sarcosine oxidase
MDADVAVIGVGAMGSMSLWRLAARGASVIGFERFQPGHALGSSHGETRIIRTAYHEGPEYVPLVQEAWTLWRRLEEETGVSLLVRNGGLLIGPPDGEIVQGALLSARTHNLEHQLLDAADLRRRHPQHRIGEQDVAVAEPDAGFVRPEVAVEAAAACAVARGAVLHSGCKVQTIDPDGGGVTILSDAGKHRVRHAIVAAGPWTSMIAPWANLPLSVARQAMGWYQATEPALFEASRFPIWIREAPDHVAYGFPTVDGRTVKLALHHEGATTDPDTVDRAIHTADADPLDRYVAKYLAGLQAHAVEMRVCMYTNTPDQHFVIGRVPGVDNVTVLSPCSGHGFKFASVIGDVAADFALDGGTSRNVERFNPDRFRPATSRK